MRSTPIELGLFFAGTVIIVFAAGTLGDPPGAPIGLDRAPSGADWGSQPSAAIAILPVAMDSPTFLLFLGAMCVFLLGMGIVNPLGTAQALSPFGDRAGAASALVGFFQMMAAAIGVWLAATISQQAIFALGAVLTAGSLLVR